MNLNYKIKNKRISLNEISVANDASIKKAINNALRVRISYDDRKDKTIANAKGKKTRYILPVAYGLLKNGKRAIRAYQTNGSTKRGVPKWKLFLLDNIYSWTNGTKSFKDYKEDLINLGLNLNGDKHMTTLFAITPFANDDVQVSKYNNTIDTEPVLKTDVEPTVNNQKPSINYKKTEPNKNKPNTSIDNNKEKDYYQNSTDYPTKPITKTNIGTNNEPNNNINLSTNINNGNTEPVDNTPITKGEIDNNIANNVLTNTYNDMMNRMDNLNKDNNEDEIEYGN